MPDPLVYTLYEKLSRTGLGKLAITGMDMHALNNTEGRKIQEIARDLKIIIFRHNSILHEFPILL